MSSLKISNIVYFDHMHTPPQLLLDPCLLPCPSNIVILFLKTHQIQLVGPSTTGAWLTHQETKPLEKTNSLFTSATSALMYMYTCICISACTCNYMMDHSLKIIK